MNNTEKKAGLVERFKKYLLDNAEYFAVASAVMSGNGYAAGQIREMQDVLQHLTDRKNLWAIGDGGKRIFLRSPMAFFVIVIRLK